MFSTGPGAVRPGGGFCPWPPPGGWGSERQKLIVYKIDPQESQRDSQKQHNGIAEHVQKTSAGKLPAVQKKTRCLQHTQEKTDAAHPVKKFPVPGEAAQLPAPVPAEQDDQNEAASQTVGTMRTAGMLVAETPYVIVPSTAIPPLSDMYKVRRWMQRSKKRYCRWNDTQIKHWDTSMF